MANLQVKDLPEDVHAELRRRAALRGVTIRDYVLDLLRRDQRRPPLSEWLDSARALAPAPGTRSGLDDLRAVRGDAA
jgi:plasmid stability protein